MKSLKVLMLNGSPHTNGNTAVALREMEAIFKENDVDVETVVLGNRDIRGCVACGACAKTGKCVFDDGVNELAQASGGRRSGDCQSGVLRLRQRHADRLSGPAVSQHIL